MSRPCVTNGCPKSAMVSVVTSYWGPPSWGSTPHPPVSQRARVSWEQKNCNTCPWEPAQRPCKEKRMQWNKVCKKGTTHSLRRIVSATYEYSNFSNLPCPSETQRQWEKDFNLLMQPAQLNPGWVDHPRLKTICLPDITTYIYNIFYIIQLLDISSMIQ